MLTCPQKESARENGESVECVQPAILNGKLLPARETGGEFAGKQNPPCVRERLKTTPHWCLASTPPKTLSWLAHSFSLSLGSARTVSLSRYFNIVVIFCFLQNKHSASRLTALHGGR